MNIEPGKEGPRGERGEQGKQGEQGIPGKQGLPAPPLLLFAGTKTENPDPNLSYFFGLGQQSSGSALLSMASFKSAYAAYSGTEVNTINAALKLVTGVVGEGMQAKVIFTFMRQSCGENGMFDNYFLESTDLSVSLVFEPHKTEERSFCGRATINPPIKLRNGELVAVRLQLVQGGGYETRLCSMVPTASVGLE